MTVQYVQYIICPLSMYIYRIRPSFVYMSKLTLTCLISMLNNKNILGMSEYSTITMLITSTQKYMYI